eukprot:GFUD01033260.1.p1 GENE.GFUD01033260.1~~GFUD01033260.1.p1  ORF type:complete len:136 (+),score=20.54 GFUD01033260.1:51-410(+)
MLGTAYTSLVVPGVQKRGGLGMDYTDAWTLFKESYATESPYHTHPNSKSSYIKRSSYQPDSLLLPPYYKLQEVRNSWLRPPRSPRSPFHLFLKQNFTQEVQKEMTDDQYYTEWVMSNMG